MVFDHQMHAINVLTRFDWESRVAAANGRVDFGSGILRGLVDELTDYGLLRDLRRLAHRTREAVYRRMWTVLSGDTSRKYSHLSDADRRAIIEILRDTKADAARVFVN